MDITMIGLQNAGKTSLLRVLAVGYTCRRYLDLNFMLTGCGRVESSPSSEIPMLPDYCPRWVNVVLTLGPCSSIPTVGFNMKRVQRGHVTLKW